jgi:hypothetical protein
METPRDISSRAAVPSFRVASPGSSFARHVEPRFWRSLQIGGPHAEAGEILP